MGQKYRNFCYLTLISIDLDFGTIFSYIHLQKPTITGIFLKINFEGGAAGSKMKMVTILTLRLINLNLVKKVLYTYK